MAENTIRVDSTGSPIPTYSVSDAVLKNTYIYSVGSVAGVVAANNYITIENPTGSGKTVLILGFFLSAQASAASAATNPMKANRIGLTTGGTQVPTASICKPDSSIVDPVALVHTGNPTVTLGDQIFTYPAFVTAGASSSQPYPVDFSAIPGGFKLIPGEGMAINSAGDATTRLWNFSILWGEL